MDAMWANVFSALKSDIPTHRMGLCANGVCSPAAPDNSIVRRDLAAVVAPNLAVNHGFTGRVLQLGGARASTPGATEERRRELRQLPKPPRSILPCAPQLCQSIQGQTARV